MQTSALIRQRFGRRRSEHLTAGRRDQGIVEYVLILILTAAVVMAVLMFVGTQVKNVFCNVPGGIAG